MENLRRCLCVFILLCLCANAPHCSRRDICKQAPTQAPLFQHAMSTPQPDPSSFGGRPDPGSPRSGRGTPKPAAKRPLKGIWTAKDGGPGPADWRNHKGNVRGQARRKGEKNPMKFGLDVDESILGHPRMANWKELPPKAAPKQPKQPKPLKASGAKKCVVM